MTSMSTVPKRWKSSRRGTQQSRRGCADNCGTRARRSVGREGKGALQSERQAEGGTARCVAHPGLGAGGCQRCGPASSHELHAPRRTPARAPSHVGTAAGAGWRPWCSCCCTLPAVRARTLRRACVRACVLARKRTGHAGRGRGRPDLRTRRAAAQTLQQARLCVTSKALAGRVGG